MSMKAFLVFNEGLQLSRACFITVLTCECLKSFESITVIKNDTNKFHWTSWDTSQIRTWKYTHTNKHVVKQTDLQRGAPFSNQGKNNNNNNNTNNTRGNWTGTEERRKGTACLCCGKWDFQCGSEWNHDPRNGLLGSHPDINMWEGWPSVCACVCSRDGVCVLCVLSSSSWGTGKLCPGHWFHYAPGLFSE